jgi:hypothetical protein
VGIPLITGALISRVITEPVLSFSLQVRLVNLLFDNSCASSGVGGLWRVRRGETFTTGAFISRVITALVLSFSLRYGLSTCVVCC